MAPIQLSARDFSQFGTPAEHFRVIVNQASAGLVEAAAGPDGDGVTLELPDGVPLADFLNQHVPDGADVLAVCPDQLLSSPGSELGRRRLLVLPAGSTPLTAAQVQYFLGVATRGDAQAEAAAAQGFFDRLAEADSVAVVDDEQGTRAKFDPFVAGLVWNQQAGPLEPGEQQIAPAGELSVLPAEITGFDPDGRLPLDGELVLRGWPIVHSTPDADDRADQARIFGAIRSLAAAPIVAEIEGGVITGLRAVDARATAAVEALTELFALDSRYRIVWELGFGINPVLEVRPGNCGPNEVYGGPSGAIHLGIGLMPDTRHALTFAAAGSRLTADDGRTVFGPEPRVAAGGRLRRVVSSSCGCH
jgi:hypothetical protein